MFDQEFDAHLGEWRNGIDPFNYSGSVSGLAEDSILYLLPAHRAMGKVIRIPLDQEPASQGLKDLAADGFQMLLQPDPRYRTPSTSRLINDQILKWAAQVSAFNRLRLHTVGNLPASAVAAAHLFATLTDDQVLQQIFARQEELEQLLEELAQAEEEAEDAREEAEAAQAQRGEGEDAEEEEEGEGQPEEGEGEEGGDGDAQGAGEGTDETATPGEGAEDGNAEGGAMGAQPDAEASEDVGQDRPSEGTPSEGQGAGSEDATSGDATEGELQGQNREPAGGEDTSGATAGAEAATGEEDTAEGGSGGEDTEEGHSGDSSGAEAAPGDGDTEELDRQIQDLVDRAVEAEKRAQDLKDQAEELERELASAVEDFTGDRMNTSRTAQRMKEAQVVAEEVADMMTGWGMGQGHVTRKDARAALRFMELYSDKLYEVSQHIGRARGFVRKRDTNEVTQAPFATKRGVTKRPDRLYAHELASLSPTSPRAFRAMKMARFVENGLPGHVPSTIGKDRGAAVFAVDASGSMMGGAEVLAKGTTLGLAMGAADLDDRPWAAFMFSATRGSLQTITSAGDWEGLLAWVERFIGGGTDIGMALDHAMDLAEELQERGHRPDIVLLSDGHGWIADEVIERWKKFQAEHDARLIYVPIGVVGQRVLEEMGAQVIPVSAFTQANMDELAQTLGGIL